MLNLSEGEMIEKIEQGRRFEACCDGFVVKILEYAPYVCMAIHSGHALRSDLEAKCNLTEEERSFEEASYTDEMIASMPIVITGRDSQYEYDLNQPIDQCIYQEAWGKQVWKEPISAEQRQTSYDKYKRFYRVVYVLLEALEARFQAVVVYDIHSYNYKRHPEEKTPTFNIGTSQLDKKRWKNEIAHFIRNLKQMELPNIEVTAFRDKIFQGRGYLTTYVQDHFENTLILPTEIKKIFMEENTGEVYPLVLFELKLGLVNAIASNAAYFSMKRTRQRVRKNDLLPSNIEPLARKVDHELYQITKGMETLLYINPINLQQEKKRFFSQKRHYTPNFRYRQLDIDPYQFREWLYRLPVDEISDVSVQLLYRKVIDAYAAKIDLLTSIGTSQFLYNSLKYYGEPTVQDGENAKFILYANDSEAEEGERLNAEQARHAFLEAIQAYGLQCRVELSSKILAKAMVNNMRKTILINKRETWLPKELEALIHHELGVHMVTTINSDYQPLKVFKLGLPGNTHTQEGLAIISEYLTDCLPLRRLKVLALRVIAVEMLVKRYSFFQIFEALMDQSSFHQDEVFNIVVRVFRGGGFTKDYLYLRGLRDALFYFQAQNINNLFIGKTSFEFLDLINELTSRGIITVPKFLPQFVTTQKTGNEVLNFIVRSIR